LIWFTADEHYYHSNIISNRFRERRPFNTVDEMNRTLIRNHNEFVSDGDLVYHLGDFTFSKNLPEARTLLSKLKGRHILILGNHDLFKPFDYIEMGFEGVHTSLELNTMFGTVGRPTLIHDPAVAGVFKEDYFIHGHTHGLGLHLAHNTFGVSVELHNYHPVSIQDITFKER
jgi:calcineurin-like phosphoesterase family protein